MTKQKYLTKRILQITAALLAAGRPRKMPGKTRAEAMSFGPDPVSYKSRSALQYSLGGALRAAAYSLRGDYSKATLSRARNAAIKACAVELVGEGFTTLPIDLIDSSVEDTREVQRAVKRAIKRAAA